MSVKIFSWICLFLIFISFQACSSLKLVTISNTQKNITEQGGTTLNKTQKLIGFNFHKITNDPIVYAPIEKNEQWNYIREIRVNIHFMHDSTSNENIPLEEVEAYSKNLIWGANQKLLHNLKMHLPEDNNTPILEPHYKYTLYPNTKEAVFVHHDSELFFYIPKGKGRNNSSRKVIKKYAVNEDSILNIFVMPLMPDGKIMQQNPNYHAGIAMGHSLKISGNFHTMKTPAWKFNNILNHEIGHILGLSHSWIRNDGCDDTPSHKNCYNISDNPPCNKITSNNMMDYNYSQSALTPCQIGKIHLKIAKLNSRERKLIIKDWCQLDTTRKITIDDSIRWVSSKDLNHNVFIAPNAVLDISCRVSFAPNSYIYVAPGATLILDKAYLHNDCGKTWKGIILASKGKVKANIIYRNEVLIENVKDNTE